MSTEIMHIDVNYFSAMAGVMGMGIDSGGDKKAYMLARLKIQHSPIMGEVEVKGKKTQAAIVNGGSYRIDDLASESVFYSDDVTIRPYVQRFMYKKFVKPESGKGFYVKTIMADNLNVDLKDNMGGFNCGKPAGFVKDSEVKLTPFKTYNIYYFKMEEKAVLFKEENIKILTRTVSSFLIIIQNFFKCFLRKIIRNFYNIFCFAKEPNTIFLFKKTVNFF